MRTTMNDTVNEDALPPDAGRELVLRSMRKVLTRRGYSGERLEARIQELLKRDFPRLTAAMASVPSRLKPKS